MDELPVLKKCCFCIPLRYGLLTWGYIKLTIAATALLGYLFLIAVVEDFAATNSFVSTIYGLLGTIIATEVVIHILFIIGAHKKKIKYLKIYYTYAIVMWVTILVMSIIGTILLVLIKSWEKNKTKLAIVFSIDAFCIFIALASQSFLVISIRSEIIKLRSNCPYRFVKDDNEHEGTVNSVKADDIITNDNGTVRIL